MSHRACEYLFLCLVTLACTLLAVAADLVNLQVSREYFTYGKGLEDNEQLPWAVAWLAVRASYWVGAILAVALLSANSFGARPVLAIRQLRAMVLLAMVLAVFAAVLLGGVFYTAFEWVLSPLEARVMLRQPKRFAFVWGCNYGAYLAAGAALLILPACIWRMRRRGSSPPAARADIYG